MAKLFTCTTYCLLSPLRFPFSFHFSSHTINPSPPPVSLFLLTECDFSPSRISKIMQTQKCLLKSRSANTAREAVEFLKQWGFTQPQLHTTILRYPPLLQYKVDTLRPKLDFFRTLGFTDQDLRNLIYACPRVLGLNLERNMIPKIYFLESLLGSKPNVIKALKRTPSLLQGSDENKLKPKFDFFKQWGIQGELLSLLLKINSGVLVRYSINILRVQMEYVKNTMGIVHGSKTFVYAICACISNGPQTLERKMKHLQSLGFLEDEVREVLKKNPWLLAFSTNKLQENMDFLTHTVGLKPNVVLSNSNLFHMSVRNRLRPRHAIYKALSSKQQSMPSLLSIFKMSERRFLEEIVECNPQASMLKEIYKGKMESADIGTT